MTIELKRRTIYDAIEQIVATARSEPRDWLVQYATTHGIDGPETIRCTVHLMNEPAKIRERLQVPRETAVFGGDFEDCAVLAISLADALELPYEIVVKGTTLYLYVNGTEVLHK
jgi:hypothetical protein